MPLVIRKDNQTYQVQTQWVQRHHVKIIVGGVMNHWNVSGRGPEIKNKSFFVLLLYTNNMTKPIDLTIKTKYDRPDRVITDPSKTYQYIQVTV